MRAFSVSAATCKGIAPDLDFDNYLHSCVSRIHVSGNVRAVTLTTKTEKFHDSAVAAREAKIHGNKHLCFRGSTRLTLTAICIFRLYVSFPAVAHRNKD